MTQAKTIYSILIRSRNRAADAALLLALPKAEPPYQNAILETILDRANVDSTLELVRNFHLYPPDWQNLLTERMERLAGALYQAVDLPDIQIRSNILTMIHRAKTLTLSNLVCLLLRDREQAIARQAAQVLHDLAISANPTPSHHGKTPPAALSEENTDRLNPQAHFRFSLQNAVRQFAIHKQKQAVLSAMLYADATDADFWQNVLDPWQPQHAMAKEWMQTWRKPELARFTISALRHNHLRGHAARILRQTTDSNFLAALAEQVTEFFDTSSASSLKWIKNPLWLEQPIDMSRFSLKALEGIIFLIEHLQAENFEKAEFLCRLLPYCPAASGMNILSLLAQIQAPNRMEVLLATLQSSYEPLAEEALRYIIRLNPPHLLHILSRQLRSPHWRVRERAQRYFRRIAFRSYWNRFDQMTPARRKSAGRAVFKIDPASQARWIRFANHKNSALRLRAVQMARILQRVSQAIPEIIRLTNDPDVRVRSCAVAALGELHAPAPLEAEKCLVDHLHDMDSRVCANAVEAVQKQNLTHTQTIIEKFSRASHPRVRANSLKTLLQWKVQSAQRMMKDMLRDSRPNHRRSALWLLRNMPRKRNIQELLNHPENIHESASV